MLALKQRLKVPPANIDIVAWNDHPDRFVVRNLLDDYSKVTLDQVNTTASSPSLPL
jgi:transcription antitermination factor NusA-like protein